MAFDGIVVRSLASELSLSLSGGFVRKIAEPEPDELILTIQTPAKKNASGIVIKDRANYKLKLSANASYPLVYLTNENKPSPLSAPNFCMLLRKHLMGARIESIEQIGLERVLSIRFYCHNELFDDVYLKLNTELMGKHSNIILINEDDTIIDSIKHVNALTSSVREVLPGKKYFIPNTMEKIDPENVDTDTFNQIIFKKPTTVAKAMAGSITGFSYCITQELAYRAGLDGDAPIASLNGNERSRLMDKYRELMAAVKDGVFSPSIYYDSDMPAEFSAVALSHLPDLKCISYDSISEVIRTYYSERESLSRIRSKSQDLTNVVKTNRERCAKKLDLLTKQLKDTEKKDKYKVYGELINTYGYALSLPRPEGEDKPDKLSCINHYTGEETEIPIDPHLSVSDNANRYFEKYNKQKRTHLAVSGQIEEAKNELYHLESVLTELDMARSEADLGAIRDELVLSGYIKKAGSKKRSAKIPKSSPLHFISSDGYDIYVGKNNYQNEDITFRLATGNDWWFHAKQMPGSHVVLKANDTEPPDTTFEEAAALAAYFSKGRGSEKLEIDYIKKKHVKKPASGKPGFVVYYTNYSMIAKESDLKRVKPYGEEEKLFL